MINTKVILSDRYKAFRLSKLVSFNNFYFKLGYKVSRVKKYKLGFRLKLLYHCYINVPRSHYYVYIASYFQIFKNIS